MLDIVSPVKQYFKVQHEKVSIDDIVFKLHYRITFVLLIVSCILVTQRQYIGEHIKCIADAGVPENVINTFCFFSSTYTVPKHLNESALALGHLPHPGVGPAVLENNDEIIHHTYYQWVPFVLFLQAITFYMPHYLWKKKEGGKLQSLLTGLRLVFMPHYKEDQKVNDKENILSEENALKKIDNLKHEFVRNIHKYSSWPVWLVICEVLNLVNLIIQMFITDWFLGGNFWGLGSQVWDTNDWDTYLDPLDVVFPKVTKCIFYKYGPSGTIQHHDALCVMSLNVIHEKIYTILWFWYVILGILTVLSLILTRLLTFALHARVAQVTITSFEYACPGSRNIKRMLKVTKERHYGDWLFLYFLAKNMNSYTFSNFIERLTDDFRDPTDFDDENKIEMNEMHKLYSNKEQ